MAYPHAIYLDSFAAKQQKDSAVVAQSAEAAAAGQAVESVRWAIDTACCAVPHRSKSAGLALEFQTNS